MAYCTAAQVQALAYPIKAEVTRGTISTTDITNLAAQVADPVIDAALYGRGSPFTTVPTLVASISAWLTAAAVFENYLSHRDDLDAAWGGSMRKRAMELLQMIQSGELSAAGITTPDMVAIGDPTLDRPETEVFTGDETDWEMRDEVRE